MALPTTARPGSFIIALGDGGDPEVFTAPCGFTSKAFSFARNLSEVQIFILDDRPESIVPRHVFARDHGDDARHLQRFAHVDARKCPMRHATADDADKQLPMQRRNVFEERRFAGHMTAC